MSVWRAGDRVYWRMTTRSGYGYAHNVAAVVDGVGPKKVRIRTALKQRDGRWKPVYRNVDAARLIHRTETVPRVDQPEVSDASA